MQKLWGRSVEVPRRSHWQFAFLASESESPCPWSSSNTFVSKLRQRTKPRCAGRAPSVTCALILSLSAAHTNFNSVFCNPNGRAVAAPRMTFSMSSASSPFGKNRPKELSECAPSHFSRPRRVKQPVGSWRSAASPACRYADVSPRWPWSFHARPAAAVSGEICFCFSHVTSGTVQGDPLGGSIDVLAADSVLGTVESAMAERGKLWACADDLAASLAGISAMKALVPIFAKAEVVAGLWVSATKPVVVPLIAAASERVCRRVRRRIAVDCPGWSRFALEGVGRYLGFWIGQAAGTKQWVAAWGTSPRRVER